MMTAQRLLRIINIKLTGAMAKTDTFLNRKRYTMYSEYVKSLPMLLLQSRHRFLFSAGMVR